MGEGLGVEGESCRRSQWQEMEGGLLDGVGISAGVDFHGSVVAFERRKLSIRMGSEGPLPFPDEGLQHPMGGIDQDHTGAQYLL